MKFKSNYQLPRKRQHKSEGGFTMLELLVVIIIVGILSAIAGPSWLSFITKRRVTAANEMIFRAVREAQSEAKKNKVSYSIIFRNEQGFPQFAIEETSDLDNNDFDAYWRTVNLNGEIKPGQLELQSTITEEITHNGTEYESITFDDIGTLDETVNFDNAIVTVVALNTTTGEVIESTEQCIKLESFVGAMTTKRGSDCTQQE